MARMRGMPNLPILVIPHPFIVLEPDQVRARAEESLEPIVQIVTGRS